MNVVIYPKRDIYFFEGIKHIFRGGELNCELQVLNVSKWSLREIISSGWLEKNLMSPSLIITEPLLTPVANYFYFFLRNAIVLDSRKILISDLYSIKDWGYLLSSKQISRLTPTEYRTLKCLFKSMSVDEEAYYYNVSKKAIYAVRSSVALKLGVRKLNEILKW
ncbi:hypothetical protein ACMV5I_27885 [Serratia sp. T13T92]|uniref:hypothetical protein n=1 Tax=Serratia sp. T13T92 TaxID=3397496 RepID=UPI0039DFED9B